MIRRKLFYIASSEKDLVGFPAEVRQEVAFALKVALDGQKAFYAVPLSGFGGSSVPEVIVNYNGDTYRTVYTVRFKNAVYVLHAFMKKSKRGHATPKMEIDLVRARLKLAKAHYERNFSQENVRLKNGDL